MSCKATVSLPQNSSLSTSDILNLAAASTIYQSTGSVKRFKSASDYLKYKIASSLAGSVDNPKLPPQSSIITQLQSTCNST